MFSSKLIVPERCSVCLDVQSCPTLRNALDYNLPGSSVLGIFQAEYWSGLPFPPPGDLPDSGINPVSPALQEDSLPSEPSGSRPSPFEMENFFFVIKFLLCWAFRRLKILAPLCILQTHYSSA